MLFCSDWLVSNAVIGFFFIICSAAMHSLSFAELFPYQFICRLTVLLSVAVFCDNGIHALVISKKFSLWM